jgi:hypothetical protein
MVWFVFNSLAVSNIVQGWILVRHGNTDANWIVNNYMLLNIETKNEKGTGTVVICKISTTTANIG